MSAPPSTKSGWIDGIERELDWTAQAAGRRRARSCETIFFGGGTPSLMSGSVRRHASWTTIARLWPMANDVEITLEANPASADAARFADYRAAGVNRLSLGVQALNDADLKMLGRLHDVAEAKARAGAGDAQFRPRLAGSDLCPSRPERWRNGATN